MDLTKFELPSAIEVDGNIYKIHTEFQYFLSFINAVKNAKNSDVNIDFMFVSKIPQDKQKALYSLLEFAYPKKELPRQSEEVSDDIIFSYELDSDLIYSAFYEQYKIDLFETKLHWYKFQSLLQGLQNTKLNKVMEYRSYKPTSSDSNEYKKQMNKLKMMWEIQEELSDEEKEILADFDKKIKC